MLCSGLGRVLVLFVPFVLINLSQAFIITRVARLLDRSRFILFICFVLVLFYWLYFIHSIMAHCACSVYATSGV
jgi:hypothetical protein